MRTVSLRKNYIFNLILTASSLVFPLLSYKLVSGILLPEGTGKVSFAVSIVTYFNMFAQLGIPTYGIRTVAKLRDDPEALNRTVKELTLLSLITAAISYAVLFLLLAAVPKMAAEKSLYLAVCPIILLNAVGMEWLYKGLEQYRYVTVRSVIFKLIAFLGVALLIREKSDYVLYGGLTVFASSASNLCNLFGAGGRLFGKKEKLNLSMHIRPVLVFFAMTCAINVYTNLDTVMLGFMTGDAEVGYYDAAVKLKSVLALMVTALSAVILPRAAYYHEQGMKQEFVSVIRKSVKLALCTAVPLTVFLIAFAGEGIRLISGPSFDPAIRPMHIIMPTLILVGISNIFGMQVLVPTGREKETMYSVVAGAVTDAVLNLFLIPKLGASGAALGTLVAEAVVLAVQTYYLRGEVKDYLAGLPVLRLLLASAGSLAVSLLLKTADFGDAVKIILAAMVFGIVYVGLMFATKAVTVRELKE